MRGLARAAHMFPGRAWLALGLILLWTAAGCGRSERIGWSDRESAERDTVSASEENVASEESVTAGAGKRDLPEPRAGSSQPQNEPPKLDINQGAPPRGSAQVPPDVIAEYQRLNQELAPIREQALTDSALAARWEMLHRELTETVVDRSEFHRRLLEREREIVARMDSAETGQVTITAEEETELRRHFANIQKEMTRARGIELQSPEWAARMKRFDEAVYDEMRELAPDRVDEIDRMEALGTRIYRAFAASARTGGEPDSNGTR